jgi:hypothetical protein
MRKAVRFRAFPLGHAQTRDDRAWGRRCHVIDALPRGSVKETVSLKHPADSAEPAARTAESVTPGESPRSVGPATVTRLGSPWPSA